MAISVGVILFGAIVDRLFDETLPRQLARVLLGYPILWGLAAIGAVALRQVFPLRDTDGKIAAGQSAFRLQPPAFWRLQAVGWAMSFLVVFIGVVILARSVTGAYADEFPWWDMGLTAILSLAVLDVPIRVLWRVPSQFEGLPSDR